MSLLGNIWVKLGLKSDDFQKGVDKAQSRAERFGASLGKVTARMVLAWAAVAAAVTKVFKTSIENYNQQEKANRKLEGALKNTGALIGLNYNDLKEYASELQKVNGYAGDVTMNAMATLTTFRSVQGDVFKKTIAAAQDMASFLGTDLNAAVKQLGQALESPLAGITALRRSGVVFSDEMTKAITKLVGEGKQYEAQLLILEEVQKRFGGEAARQADTAAGQWERVGLAFGDLTTHIGAASEASKNLASNLASALETADKIISSNALSGWQKLGVFLGIGQKRAAELMLAEDKMAQHAQDYANKAVAGIHNVEEAQAELRRQQAANARVSSDQAKADTAAAVEAIKTRIAQYEAEEATKEEERKRAAAAAAEEAKRQKEWMEQHSGILNELKDEIAAKETLLNMAKDTTEIARLREELRLLKERQEMLRSGTRNIDNPLAAVDTDVVAKRFAALSKMEAPGIDTSALKASRAELNKWTNDLYDSIEVSQEFATALQDGLLNTFDELADAIGTGDWDTSALLKALLTPLADAAISAGIIVSGLGKAIESMKISLTSLQGPIAIAAGAALIAAGVAAKAGLAAIAKNGASGSGAGSSNSYTYTGGYGALPTTNNAGAVQLAGTVTVKGQDIQIALDNYNKNRKR